MVNSHLLSTVVGVIHGFGTLSEPQPDIFSEDLEFPRWHQNHGTGVVRVDLPRQDCKEVDALYTFRHGLPIGVVTADCVPILMARRSGEAVAAIHAGWRGTRARMIREVWQKLRQEGEQPEDWVAAVGPAIGPCCYEVSEAMCADFLQHFAAFGEARVAPRKRHLDLPAINESELMQLGLHQVEVIRMCTRCSSDPIFFSHRREAGGGRQWSVVMRE